MLSTIPAATRAYAQALTTHAGHGHPPRALPPRPHHARPALTTPRKARKLVANHYVDLGQGLLDCLHEIHEQTAPRP